ncbi:MAG: riboflavin biosynthesis protein RibF, partial [Cyanobacteria bacterium J06648_11]
GRSLAFLTPLPEKLALLEAMGIEQVVLLPFSREFASRNPQSFLADILETGLHACQVSVGWDFCFGRQRAGNADTLRQWGRARQVPVDIVPEWQVTGQRASSSAIRQALAEGEVTRAKAFLGRCYSVRGLVETGDRRGRHIGFPTANVRVSKRKVLPRDGVYAGSARWTSRDGTEERAIAAINIGQRPTFDGKKRTVEVHLLDWSGDLYDRVLHVELEQFLRPERKFAGIEALQAQLQQDCQHARQIMTQASPSETYPTLSPV